MHALSRLLDIGIGQPVVEYGVVLHADLGTHARGHAVKHYVGHVKFTLNLAQQYLSADVHILARVQIQSCTVLFLLARMLIYALSRRFTPKIHTVSFMGISPVTRLSCISR